MAATAAQLSVFRRSISDSFPLWNISGGAMQWKIVRNGIKISRLQRINSMDMLDLVP